MKTLSFNEMEQINGGSKIGDFFRSVGDAICDAADWVWDHAFVAAYNGIISVGLKIPF